jgi:fructose-1,6-bisphosphatase/inositol monophosphatase family enzyme
MLNFDKWTNFALECISEAIENVSKIGTEGKEIIEKRRGEYRWWDAEVLRVDKLIETLFIKKLTLKNIKAKILSEELGEKEIVPSSKNEEFPEEIYFVSDPFDGSLLYKRGIPAFWFTSLAIYDKKEAKVKTAVVGDCRTREVWFTTSNGAFEGRFKNGELIEIKRLKVTGGAEQLQEAFLQTYLMKPYYMYPTVQEFEQLFSKVKFILPNGGPSGFTDIANQRLDIYLAYRQPFVDVFSGLPIAEKAGAIITNFKGEKVKFNPDLNKRFNIVCSRNVQLHTEVLKVLKEISFRGEDV